MSNSRLSTKTASSAILKWMGWLTIIIGTIAILLSLSKGSEGLDRAIISLLAVVSSVFYFGFAQILEDVRAIRNAPVNEWEEDLPEHIISDETPLPNGMRVQINVKDANLSRAQCVSLIEAYREKAMPEGQISVHKPSTVKALNGAILIYCIDNLDGKGITFPDAK